MGSQPQKDYIVMLPFLAHGHLTPFLALAKLIHQRTGFTLIIATTKLNLHYLRRSSSSEDSGVHFAELPFSSSDHGLPPNTETTENLPLPKVIDLFHASRSLEPPSRNLILELTGKYGRPPLCIISDVFLGWAVDVAKSFDTVNVAFTTGGAYGSLAYISVWLNLPHRKTESDEFEVPGFPKRCRFHRSHLHPFLRAADGSDPWSRFFQIQTALSLKSHSWLCYTVEELEPFGVEIFRDYVKRPVWCVGPLLPQSFLNDTSFSQRSVSKQRVRKELGISAEELFEWLGLQEPQSVLYISFGSQNTIGPTQMMELAKGLELSEKPFVWVIRPPVGFDLREEFRPEWLPEKFEERMKEKKRGLLVRNWAPQLDILAHTSTGGFLSHCGWNSVMESLSQGVPIIGWPLAAEQGYNSKMLMEEKRVSVELTRGAQGAIVGDGVKKVIDLVMDKNGEGGEMKKRANEIKLQIRASMREEGEHKGSAIKAMDDFVASILAHREEEDAKDRVKKN